MHVTNLEGCKSVILSQSETYLLDKSQRKTKNCLRPAMAIKLTRCLHVRACRLKVKAQPCKPRQAARPVIVLDHPASNRRPVIEDNAIKNIENDKGVFTRPGEAGSWSASTAANDVVLAAPATPNARKQAI